MARRVFPDDGSRLAYSASGSVLRPVAAGSVVSVFTDAGASVVADCLHSGGAPVTTNDPLRVDAYSRLPLWQGPADGTDTLYVVVSGGPATAVYARADDRLDDHETRIAAAEAGKQPADADLTAIAGLSPANDDLLQRKAGAWANRTPAQVKTDLGLVKGDVGLGSADNTSDAAKPVSTAQQAALDGKAAAVHGHVAADVADLGASATLDVGTGAGTVAAGDDSRLSDARVPTAHASSHQPGGSDALAVDAAAGVGSLRTLGTGATQAAAGSSVQQSGSDAWLKLHAGGDLDALLVGTITRDANGAAMSAGVVWPDGTTGTYTATTVSTAFPGAVDAYTVTYAGGTTKTVTQSAVARDASGAVTNRPAMTVA